LDMNAGIAVNALGHNHPVVTELIAEQAKEMIHLSNLYHHPYGGPFAKELVTRLPCSKSDCPGVGVCSSCREKGRLDTDAQVFFCNSGAEANEGAIKFARKVGKQRDPKGEKIEVVSFSNAFHGRTLGALSATPSPKYQKPFFPLVPGFKKGTFNDTQEALELITEKTCAVIIEPIQGEGGIHVSKKSFLEAIRTKCDQIGALLIFDEIQVTSPSAEIL
jgi:acetylornithine aminotransferase